MSVHLTRRTCLRVPSVAVLDHDGPREYLRGLVHLVENIQHCLAAGPTGQMVKVQLGHAPKGLGIKLGKDLVRQQGVHPPGRQEVVLFRIDDMPSGTELVDQLVSQVRQCVRCWAVMLVSDSTCSSRMDDCR